MAQNFTPEMQNIAMASNAAVYSLVIPAKTRKINIRSRLSGDLKVALTEAAITSGPYVTIPASQLFFEMLYLKEQTWYFQSTQNVDVLEVFILKDSH